MKSAFALTPGLGWMVTAGLLFGALWRRQAFRAGHERSTLYDELGLLRDELERERCERELVSRRAAHDLRNTLTPIRARAEILIRKLGDDPEHVRHAEAILRSVMRADALIQQLVDASRAPSNAALAAVTAAPRPLPEGSERAAH